MPLPLSGAVMVSWSYMKKESLAVVSIVLVVIIAASVAGYFTFFSRPAAPVAPAGPGGQLSSTDLKGDINRDGAVNSEDAEFIRKATPCNHVDPCWKKVVGKTKDGDNPIYTSDLDLNHDDNVNELDISAMSAQ